MNKKDRLNALIAHFAEGNKSRFASKLGVSPQAISTWEKRNTFDAELIFTKCENINGTWLLSGLGEMLLNEHETHDSDDSMVDRLFLIIDKKDAVIQQQAEELGQLREQVAQLKQRLGKDAEAAHISRTANVG